MRISMINYVVFSYVQSGRTSTIVEWIPVQEYFQLVTLKIMKVNHHLYIRCSVRGVEGSQYSNFILSIRNDIYYYKINNWYAQIRMIVEWHNKRVRPLPWYKGKNKNSRKIKPLR